MCKKSQFPIFKSPQHELALHHCLVPTAKDPKMVSNLELRGAKRPWDGEHPDLMEAVEAVNFAAGEAAAAKPFLSSPCPFEPWI